MLPTKPHPVGNLFFIIFITFHKYVAIKITIKNELIPIFLPEKASIMKVNLFLIRKTTVPGKSNPSKAN